MHELKRLYSIYHCSEQNELMSQAMMYYSDFKCITMIAIFCG